MAREFPLRAFVMQIEFTVAASQTVKTRIVREKHGGKLSIWGELRELERALDRTSGRIAA